MSMALLPCQNACFEDVLRFAKPGRIVLIGGGVGSGKSVLLQRVAEALYGELLTMRQFLEWQRDAHPLRLEETLEWLLSHHLAQSEAVCFDDLHRLLAVMRGPNYPRQGYVEAALTDLRAAVRAEGKTLVCVCPGSAPSCFEGALTVSVPPLGQEDARVYFEGVRGLGRPELAQTVMAAGRAPNLYQLAAIADLLETYPDESPEAVATSVISGSGMSVGAPAE